MIQFTFESECQGFGRGDGVELAETFRTRLRAPDIQQELRAADLGISTIEQVVDIDYEEDGRMISSASVDVAFLSVHNDSRPFGVQRVAKVVLDNNLSGNSAVIDLT